MHLQREVRSLNASIDHKFVLRIVSNDEARVSMTSTTRISCHNPDWSLNVTQLSTLHYSSKKRPQPHNLLDKQTQTPQRRGMAWNKSSCSLGRNRETRPCTNARPDSDSPEAWCAVISGNLQLRFGHMHNLAALSQARRTFLSSPQQTSINGHMGVAQILKHSVAWMREGHRYESRRPSRTNVFADRWRPCRPRGFFLGSCRRHPHQCAR